MKIGPFWYIDAVHAPEVFIFIGHWWPQAMEWCRLTGWCL